jgi:subtilisin-like proprotein convertase family protein
MNFVVKDTGGLLGYSPLGGSVQNGGAVILDIAAFGSGAGCPSSGIVPGAPYNLGRTTTHELGHFYGLNHTFNADGGGSCGAGGDGIADTPEVANSTYGCPSNPTPFACNAPERRLTMNYMDYVNDACMYMFTPGQMSNVDAYISGVLASQFKPNVCGPGDPGFVLTANDSPVYSCPNTDMSVDFNLTYTTIADFNEMTTFSATGLPANATVNFSPANLNDDGNFVMTVGNIGATALGEYTITVTGTSNSVTESVDVLLINNCVVVTCDDYVATDTPIVISTTGAGNQYFSTINVTEDLPIDDINVSFSIDHTWIRDITATITSPNGTEVELTSVNGVNGVGAYVNTLFDQEATTPIAGDTPANNNFVGPYIPEGDLSLIYGEMSAGDWVLTVTDNFDQDGGNLTNFAIELCLEGQLSVNEFDLNSFAIFPNPNNGEFTIKLNSNSGNDIKVNVFDIRGRSIFNNSFTNTGDFTETVNLNSVQAGMYLVTVNDGNNEVTKRIIVE